MLDTRAHAHTLFTFLMSPLLFCPHGLSKESMDCFSAGGGGAAELGVYPGQSDHPQEVPRPGGGQHAGEEVGESVSPVTQQP